MNEVHGWREKALRLHLPCETALHCVAVCNMRGVWTCMHGLF